MTTRKLIQNFDDVSDELTDFSFTAQGRSLELFQDVFIFFLHGVTFQNTFFYVVSAYFWNQNYIFYPCTSIVWNVKLQENNQISDTSQKSA